ncbi:MAG: aminodeoxychorismate lyase, partial [Steroidobacteraceae bacterium]
MNARVLVNGCDQQHIPAADRGVLYGDGLFETIRFVRGAAPLWPRHIRRLHAGCLRLGLRGPDAGLLANEAAFVLDGADEAVVRITLTRGVGERGYAPSPQAASTRIVAAHPLPVVAPDWYRRGIRVRSCGLRLAHQPRLAGIKHLNRLEQVLARAEWDDATIGEGLVCDIDGHVVGATAANLFVVLDSRLVTPAVDRCGVAGVARAEVLARREDVVVRQIEAEELMRADEIFLSSSVRGIVPVRALPG